MQVAYNVILVIASLLAVFFILLVFFTGKGDAMSGGSSAIRTTYKGKTGIDEQISRLTLYLGGGFVVLMLILDFMATRLYGG